MRLIRYHRGSLPHSEGRAVSFAPKLAQTGSRRTTATQIVNMRSVIQRVKRASVTVSGNVVAEIGPGVLCLIGVKETDTAKDQDYMCVRLCFSAIGSSMPAVSVDLDF